MSGEKTEQPTHKKLADARKKGQVAYSKDFTQTFLILAMFGYLIGAGKTLVQSLAELLLLPIDFVNRPFDQSLGPVLAQVVKNGTLVLLPFLLIVLGVGIFSDALQVGINFAFEAIKPSGKKLNALENAKNMFSKKNFVEFLKNCLKVGFLTALLYVAIGDQLGTLMTLPAAGINGVGTAVSALLKSLLINIAVVYVALALADFAWQRYSYRKGLMMSKDEVKQEYKQSEGDPHIKSARKHLHQELMTSGMVEKTRKATVVVTNPTHVAVALFYEEGQTPLPMVLAKGADLIAARIVAVAKEEGIPVMENVPLAWALLEQAEVDQYIPSDLIEPVADVLRLVQRLANGEGWNDGSE